MKSHSAYCAFCRSPLKLFRQKRLRWRQIFLILPLSVFLTYLLNGTFDPRSLVLFAVLLMAAELIIQFRWRTSIVCRVCGFDPVLYLKDAAGAARKVKNFLEIQRLENPLFQDPFLVRRRWREIEIAKTPMVSREALYLVPGSEDRVLKRPPSQSASRL